MEHLDPFGSRDSTAHRQFHSPRSQGPCRWGRSLLTGQPQLPWSAPHLPGGSPPSREQKAGSPLSWCWCHLPFGFPKPIIWNLKVMKGAQRAPVISFFGDCWKYTYHQESPTMVPDDPHGLDLQPLQIALASMWGPCRMSIRVAPCTDILGVGQEKIQDKLITPHYND